MKRRNKGAPDIFDRIMAWRVLKPLLPFYQKYKEPLLYLLFGGLTTALSVAFFWLLVYPCGMQALIANIITWIVCIAFAYITNRTWVFKDKAYGAAGVVRELFSFTLGRLATLGLEELILWIGIDLMSLNTLAVKIIAQILVIIGNYVISKFLVFKKT